MDGYRIGEAAALLGVSTDTVRRWVDAGRLAATRDAHGHRVLDARALAAFARRQAGADRPSRMDRAQGGDRQHGGSSPGDQRSGDRQHGGGQAAGRSSARNRLPGIVTAVHRDAVMAQVEIQAGPFRVVSLMSREAVDELDLRVGGLACAVIKSTNVIVERP